MQTLFDDEWVQAPVERVEETTCVAAPSLVPNESLRG